jgi:tRNA threonylcarbamoyladenosine biosynthesis protein TsaE
MSAATIAVCSNNPAETESIGAALAHWLRDGDIVLLHGDLGAGKTTFAKGVAAGLQIDAVVSSPSFALVNEYDAGLVALVTRLYHLDLYRLATSDELASIGFADLAAPSDGATLVEWPERAVEALPPQYILIEFETVAADRRRLRISAFPPDESWAPRLEDLRRRLGQLDYRPSDAGSNGYTDR